MKLISSLAFLIALATPASAQLSCAPTQKPMQDIEFLLGRSGGEVKWRAFLAREVTPRFPDGLTVYETTGQWRDPATNKITRERSRVLRVLVTPDAAVQGKVDAVAAAYKTQFGQKSVGIVSRPACVSF